MSSRRVFFPRVQETNRNLPDRLLEDRLYLEKDHTSIAFLCPCGCRSEVHIRLGTDWPLGVPSWSLEEHEGKITLSPSLQCTTRCRSHFYIRKNQVEWL